MTRDTLHFWPQHQEEKVDSQGLKNMGLGLVWFVVGCAVTFVTYGIASGGGHYVVAFGAILAGAAQFFVGVVQYIKFLSQSPVDRLLPQATTELKALLRTLIASAENDGPLDDGKIQLIKAILQKVTGKDDFSPSRLRDVSQAMARDRTKTSKYLARVQSDLSLDIKQLLLRTSAVLLTNGNETAVRARAFLRETAQALQLTDQQCAEATGGVVQYSATATTQSA
jgi:hypothetical protein